MGTTEKAIPDFEQALQREPGLAGTVSTLSITLDRRGGGQLASTLARLIQEKFPESPVGHYTTGLLAGRRARTEEAEQLFHRALKLDTGYFPAHLGLGKLYLDRGDYHQAISQFEAALEVSPNLIEGLIGLGETYLAMKRYDQAVASFKKVLGISPDSVPGLNNLAWAYAEEGTHLDDALRLAQQAKRLAPKHGAVADTLGWVFLKRNMIREAIGAFEDATELTPRHPGIRYHVGLAYAQQGRTREAMRELEEALKISPTFAEAAEARRLLSQLRRGESAGEDARPVGKGGR